MHSKRTVWVEEGLQVNASVVQAVSGNSTIPSAVTGYVELKLWMGSERSARGR